MVWALLAIAALAGVQDTSPPAGTPPPGAVPPPLAEVARSVRNRPLAERMDVISQELLGLPYALDALGEGAGPDPDPFARYDAFDCLTFVEEVLALSLSSDPLGAAAVRSDLRYGENPRTYVGRHHFMELQWIPHAVEAGWVVDTTAEYGPTVRMEKEISPETWAAWSLRPRFAHTDDELPMGTMALDVLPLDAAVAAADRIRPGTLVLTVRKDRTWSPIWISHVGFVVPGDQPTVRHATKMGSGGTRDHGLVWYLEHLQSYSRLPAVGISLLEPVEQGPRQAAPRDGS